MGVIGCAGIAWRRTLPAAVAEPSVRLVAVASRDGDKAARFAREFGCSAVHGYEELLRRDDIEAVYIPLPVALHAEWIEAALRAGKHVLAEKPLAPDAATAARLVDLAHASRLLLVENYMFTHHSQHRAVRRLLTEGVVGEPRSFAAAFTIPRLPPHDIRNRRELGGGALLDVAGYPIRAAELFLGDGLEVVGSVLRHDPDTVVDTGGAALLRSPSGVIAQLTFGIDDAYHSSYEIRGSTGRLSLGRAFTPPPDHRPLVRVEGPDGARDHLLAADDQFARVLGAFARGVRAGTGELPSGTGHRVADIVPHARLVDAVRRSAR
ncbi:oxidoreductase [Streptomyces viridochromogenes]|uniref:Oxidoreductase n=1 Tax=Streptomyces viridochromogenes TaxID=1938 RepID=A0A0J7ZN47_STRVR|nr:oxidoreductase [Streptomyces viridochromogenes]KOG19156.1 oxidoreductase [Streptomyces viridochromogenes]KOG19395.1 oxidoreductase [Streptomyces viridochromogenes]